MKIRIDKLVYPFFKMKYDYGYWSGKAPALSLPPRGPSCFPVVAENQSPRGASCLPALIKRLRISKEEEGACGGNIAIVEAERADIP